MDVLSIALGVSTALGSVGTLAYWRETRSTAVRDKRHRDIESHLTTALGPIKEDLQVIHAKLTAEENHSTVIMRAAIGEALEPLKDQISTLNTKIDPLWKALEAQAIAAAQILHQPDPLRHHIDALLEHFMEGNLTPNEELELRRFLTIIRKWEPGQDVGFPVHPGEPTAAAILLSTMDLSRVRRKQERND